MEREKIICLDGVLFEILFGIITVIIFVMWCMWDEKVVENIKKWVGKCIYDASEILFEKIWYPNKANGWEVFTIVFDVFTIW